MQRLSRSDGACSWPAWIDFSVCARLHMMTHYLWGCAAFIGAKSFNQDIDSWNVAAVKTLYKSTCPLATAPTHLTPPSMRSFAPCVLVPCLDRLVSLRALARAESLFVGMRSVLGRQEF